MFSAAADSGPAVVVRYAREERRLVCVQPTGSQVLWDIRRLRDDTVAAFHSALSETGAVPERLIYAFASKVFSVNMPRPIGGKRNPGFLTFTGASASDLVVWIVENASGAPGRRGRGRPLKPGELLEMVVEEFNGVLALQYGGCKDELDNAVLKGMRRGILDPRLRCRLLEVRMAAQDIILRRQRRPMCPTFERRWKLSIQESAWLMGTQAAL
ncbi:hypothetical protein HDU67_007681 [Dinochytrium kinnereticum]|nr:hypothetical protein HDU67_007681 [Dinochytrium kinnereticum]